MHPIFTNVADKLKKIGKKSGRNWGGTEEHKWMVD